MDAVVFLPVLLGVALLALFLDDDDGSSSSDDSSSEPDGSDVIPVTEEPVTPATLTGSAGPDIITGTPDGETINALQGNDTVTALRGDDTVSGGFGNDVLIGGGDDDNLFGNAGDDVIAGDDGRGVPGEFDGRDVLNGGTGSDILLGDNGADGLFGREGDDLLFGGFGGDRLFGFDGDDLAVGHRGEDFVRGGLGDDVVSGNMLYEGLMTADEAQILQANGQPNDPSDIARLGPLTQRDDLAADTVMGDGGDDDLYLGDADTGSGGTGADRFFVSPESGTNTAANIEDYDNAEDVIIVQHATGATAPTITVVDSGSDALILADGNVVATVAGQAGNVSASAVLVQQVSPNP